MDGLLESTLTNKKNYGTKRKLNSYEQQQEAENALWAEVAKMQYKSLKESPDDDQEKKSDDSATE
jgi:hypothetical protein